MSSLQDRIREALALTGTHTFGDVIDAVQARQAQAWGTDDAAIVTEIVAYPQQRALRVWLAAGRLESVLELFHGPVTEFGKAEGCSVAEFVGRPGWERVMTPLGWEKVGIVMRKDLGQ
jgi:hypothetical protein